MHKETFHCTKHAVINALTDLLHKESFYIRDINDRKGFLYAQQGLGFLALGRNCVIRIFEEGESVIVEVRCSNKLRIGVPGMAASIEKKILKHLQEEL